MDVIVNPVHEPIVEAGLASAEALRRLTQFGRNEIPPPARHFLQEGIQKFWGPVPWMLELSIVLQAATGGYAEAAIVGVLLVFNAGLALFQEGRAQTTLLALRARLALTAAVLRDGKWVNLPAAGLVPGDVVKLSLGGIVPADLRLVSGQVQLDQSMLTGETKSVEAERDDAAYAGALVRRGEATALVTQTGHLTKYGRMAELVQTAHVAGSEQKAVFRIVQYLAAFNGSVIAVLIFYSVYLHLPVREIIQLVLTAVLASIPVALPATFTLAAALGARALAGQGVLLTRLSAIDEAGSMDILCIDKTGTLTQNQLAVAEVWARPGFLADQVLALAALASSEGGQDSIDAAIRAAAKGKSPAEVLKLAKFVPFDPAVKMSEATVTDALNVTQRIVKGALAVVAAMVSLSTQAQLAAHNLQKKGYRVLAVGFGPASAVRLAGFLALSDPPRADAANLIQQLHGLGVRVLMLTGDAPATAAVVARLVGLTGPLFPAVPFPDVIQADQFAIFAGVLPEDKYKLVKTFQTAGHVVGMCGDGANDAPALREAQMGIAVSTATDIAKSAAGMVLTQPGLAGIVTAIREGRVIFQRIQTYTLNSIIKKIATVLLLAIALVMTGHALLSPLMMVLIMIIGDFLTMSLTTDNAQPAAGPNQWNVGSLIKAGLALGLCQLLFCLFILTCGKFWLEFDVKTLATLAFLSLVFSSQAMVYVIRDRRRLWSSRPSRWLIISSGADILIALALAATGTAMSPVPISLAAAVLALAAGFALVLDTGKRPVFRFLATSGSNSSTQLP